MGVICLPHEGSIYCQAFKPLADMFHCHKDLYSSNRCKISKICFKRMELKYTTNNKYIQMLTIEFLSLTSKSKSKVEL